MFMYLLSQWVKWILEVQTRLEGDVYYVSTVFSGKSEAGDYVTVRRTKQTAKVTRWRKVFVMLLIYEHICMASHVT